MYSRHLKRRRVLPQVKRKAGVPGGGGAPEKALSGQEQWIDGPRMSRSRLAEAYSSRQRQETWIDGPGGGPAAGHASPAGPGSLPAPHVPTTKPAARPPTSGATAQQYGFMDDHKKSMIARWVEHQIEAVTSEKRPDATEAAGRQTGHYRQLTQFKTQEQEEEPACKVMTQFKTQSSSGENSPVPERQHRAAASARKPEAAAQQVSPGDVATDDIHRIP